MFLIDPSTYSVRHTKQKGRGVFAKKSIVNGTVIGDYLGRIMPDSDEEASPELYAMYRTPTEVIVPDGAPHDTAFLNHSCEPNCAMYPYRGHIIFFALRTIFPHEELTFNYLLHAAYGEPNYYVCHCGAATCRGTWYVSPSVADAFPDILIEPQDKHFFDSPLVPFGELLRRLDSYPESIADNAFYDLFGAASQKPEVYDAETSLPSIQELRKRIRTTGRELNFTNINIRVKGVTQNRIVSSLSSDTP